jgi:hypothetical protein
MKSIAIILFVLLIVLVADVPPAEAAFCRSVDGQQVCVVSIKRSAKYYWEYRVVVSVDGVEKPLELYNCRDRVRLQPDGTRLPFQPDDLGEQVCNLFK